MSFDVRSFGFQDAKVENDLLDCGNAVLWYLHKRVFLSDWARIATRAKYSGTLDKKVWNTGVFILWLGS